MGEREREVGREREMQIGRQRERGRMTEGQTMSQIEREADIGRQGY